MSSLRLGYKSTCPVLLALFGHFFLLHVQDSRCHCCEMTYGKELGKTSDQQPEEIKAFNLAACEQLNLDISNLTEFISSFT